MSATAQPSRNPDPATAAEWLVRAARIEDIGNIVTAISALLLELGGIPPARAAMEEAAGDLLADEQKGVLLVAETEGELVGVLAASRQTAVHVPGPYLSIQDLWVERAWRSQAIGEALVRALCEFASGCGIKRLEVGLPRASFAAVDATKAFYRRNGFSPLGARMRMVLP